MTNSVPWRQVIVEELRTLASEQEQVEYERNVPHVDITVELLCGWFNDSYHPEDSGFRACFTEKELAALREFDSIFRSQENLLPRKPETVQTWLQTPEWRVVMHAAAEALWRINA
jgi:hypothetical protein